jgi:hypothetical protein
VAAVEYLGAEQGVESGVAGGDAVWSDGGFEVFSYAGLDDFVGPSIFVEVEIVFIE